MNESTTEKIVTLEEFERFLDDKLKTIDLQILQQKERESFRKRAEKYGIDTVKNETVNKIIQLQEEVRDYLRNIKVRDEKARSEKIYTIVEKNGNIYFYDGKSNKKVTDRIFKKLKLLGIYSEKEQGIVSNAIDKILDKLTASEFFHSREFFETEEQAITEVSTLSGLIKGRDNNIEILDGIGVKIAEKAKPQLFESKAKRPEPNLSVYLPYMFVRDITINEKDAFSDEMRARNSFIYIQGDEIIEIFLQDSKLYKINSKTINELLSERKVRLIATVVEGKIKFFALVENSREVLSLDETMTANIIKNLETEIRELSQEYRVGDDILDNEAREYIVEKYFRPQDAENDEDIHASNKLRQRAIDEEKHRIYLMRVYTFFEELCNRGFMPEYKVDDKQTKVEAKQALIEDKKSKTTFGLYLPYGIDGELPEINQALNECLYNEGQIITEKEFITILTTITTGEYGKSNFESYKQILANERNKIQLGRNLEGTRLYVAARMSDLVSDLVQKGKMTASQFSIAAKNARLLIAQNGQNKNNTDQIIGMDEGDPIRAIEAYIGQKDDGWEKINWQEVWQTVQESFGEMFDSSIGKVSRRVSRRFTAKKRESFEMLGKDFNVPEEHVEATTDGRTE